MIAELRASAWINRGQPCHEQAAIVKPPWVPIGTLFRLADFASVLTIPLIGSLLRQSTENLQRNLCFWTLLSAITVLLIASHGGYRAMQAASQRKQTRLAISCFLGTSLAMLSMSVLLGHSHILARHWTAADLIVTPFILTGVRAALANTLRQGDETRLASGPLVICYDHCPGDLAKAMAEQQISARVSGIFYLSSQHRENASRSWPELPDIQTLLRTIQTQNIQDVIFVHHSQLDALAATLHQELLATLLTYPARLWLAFDVASNLPKMLKDTSASCKIVPIVTDHLVSSLNLTKRIFDLAGAAILLAAFLPVLLICAALVRASGPGPVIFRQIRIGAQGRKFVVLKFRTMTCDAGRPFAQAIQHDPRTTEIGRFLRRTSLDELLQLINVLKGDMSLVGPRPHAPETEVEGINFENAVRLYRLRHRVKPGITGLAQIRGQRGETRAICMLEQRLASDLEYIQSWSLWLDVLIMFKTLPTIIQQTNAW